MSTQFYSDDRVVLEDYSHRSGPETNYLAPYF